MVLLQKKPATATPWGIERDTQNTTLAQTKKSEYVIERKTHKRPVPKSKLSGATIKNSRDAKKDLAKKRRRLQRAEG